MPTADRLQFVPLAIKYFQAQTWPTVELVIVDSGKQMITECPEIVHAMRHDTRIRWRRGEPGMLIGDARNDACEWASGEVICHWDDDDWYAPGRITEQITDLRASGKGVIGSPALMFADDMRRDVWRYTYPGAEYGVGVTLMYYKSVWKEAGGFQHFRDAEGNWWNFGEDTNFLANVRGNIHQQVTDQIVARIHDGNAVPKRDSERLKSEQWQLVPWSEVEAVGYEAATGYEAAV